MTIAPVADERLSSRPQLVVLVSLGVDCILVVAKLIAGLLTGSLGLLSEAAHSALDLVASLFTVLAIRTARKPADHDHPYGHRRAENLAAFGQGIVLLLTAIGISYEAIRRLLGAPSDVNPAWYALALMVITMGIEVVRTLVLSAVGRATRNEALKAAAANRLADIFTSAGVLAGLIGVRAGFQWADAVAALLVAVLIFRAAALLSWRSADILMDRAPTGVEDDLRRTISGVEGVREVREVRVRGSGSNLLGDARVSAPRMLSVEASQALREEVREAVAEAHPEVELALVIEADAQAANLVERVHAAAARHGGVSDLHNVTVEKEDDGSLHLSMHAKLPGQISLEQATRTSVELERVVREELPEVSRVDVHLEPLEPDWVHGEEVTMQRADLAARVRRVVERHPEVTACRDVELSSRGDRIVGHVVAQMRADVTLEHAHAVETELEDRILAEVPDVYEVVARVTT